MGAKGTAIAIGLALVAVGVLAVAAIRFLPGAIDSLGRFEFPSFPEFPEIKLPDFPEFPQFPEITFPEFPQLFPPNIMQGLPGREFTESELQAFQFKDLIKRPAILQAELVNGVLKQTTPGQATGTRLIFGSNFASVERLADLFRRFQLTGRDLPGGREKRISELVKDVRSKQVIKATRRKFNRAPPQKISDFQIQGVRRRVARSLSEGRPVAHRDFGIASRQTTTERIRSRGQIRFRRR